MSTWWQQFGLVALGGALGACGRFVIAGWMTRMAGSGFPWGTFAVNLLGCFLAGIVVVWLEGRSGNASLWRAFLIIGIIGGLTTWSALVVDMMLLNRASGPTWSGTYLVATLAGSLALLWLGMRVAHMVRG